MLQIVMWTTGEGSHEKLQDAETWRDAYFWADEVAARDNAEACGHDLIRVTAEIRCAEVVWSPQADGEEGLINLNDAEYVALQVKYAGREFVFHSPFEETLGWKDGDRGVLVRLIRVGTEDVEEANDLWVGLNLSSGGLHQLWGGEAFTPEGDPVVVEQRFLNWSPKDSGQTQHEERDETWRI